MKALPSPLHPPSTISNRRKKMSEQDEDGSWWRCCRRSTVNPRHTLQRPYVTRNTTTKARKVNATDRLPLGAILHGAEKLKLAGLDGRAVRVAVIDSGIDKHHPGFDGMVVKQEWYRAGTPLSEDDHGTHVAGTIHFMAPQATLYDYRVFGETGKYDGDTAISMAIRQAVDDGCEIINMSLRISYPIVSDVREAVEYAHSRGVVMVCAAGNSGDGDPTTNEMFT
jgi:subtilisin family serine protease